MAKKKLKYSEGVSFLGRAGTLHTLVAISYFMGYKGKLGEGARAMVQAGIDAFMSGLSPEEKRRYKEILQSVKLAGSMESVD